MRSWTDGIIRALRGEPTERQGRYAGDQEVSDGLRELLDFERGRHARHVLAARAGRDRWAARAAGRAATIRRLVAENECLVVSEQEMGAQLRQCSEQAKDLAQRRRLAERKWDAACKETVDAMAELAELKRQRGQRIEELEAELACMTKQRDKARLVAIELMDVITACYRRAGGLSVGLASIDMPPEAPDGPPPGPMVEGDVRCIHVARCPKVLRSSPCYHAQRHPWSGTCAPHCILVDSNGPTCFPVPADDETETDP